MPRYIPPLSVLISTDDLPPSLGFVGEGISSVFSNLYFKDFIVNRSYYNEEAYFNITIVSFSKLGLDFGGEEGFSLILNPGFIDGDTSEFPLSLSYYWPIIKYVRAFDLEEFDFSILATYELLLKISDISQSQLLLSLINSIYSDYVDEDENDPFQVFINDFNNKNQPTTPLVYNEIFEENLLAEDLLNQMISNGNSYNILDVIYSDYLTQDDDLGTIDFKLESLFLPFLGYNITTHKIFQNLLVPKFFASLDNLSLALTFPRTWLKPVDAEGDVIEDDSVKSMLTYNVGSLNYSSEYGFEFINADSFDLTPSQIGNTGLLISINNLKFDFRTDRNIPEADADGRPNEFQGIYADLVSITLPKKWFNNIDNTTLQVAGYNMLIGTGGVSGTIALETVGGQPNNGAAYMNLKIGNWEVGFNYFDLTFKQNAIVESNIAGRLKVPKLKDAQGNAAEIYLNGHINESGDFNLTASEPEGIPFTLFNFVTFNFLTLELGRENDKFYIGTSCQIWFENQVMAKLIGDQVIEIPRLRVYDNGTIEIVGGNGFLPLNISLNLGPIEMAVTGVHYGSTQLEYNGNMRKYNYWGFDGAISIDPFDVRRMGIKRNNTVIIHKGNNYFLTKQCLFNNGGRLFLVS